MSAAKPSESTAASSRSFSSIRYSAGGGRATITLARPPLNVVDSGMMEELLQALDAAGRGGAKVLVLRGDGKCFSAGADVAEHLPADVGVMLSRFRRLGIVLSEMEIPTVAWLHGSALGGGLELAMAADLVYAAPGTKLGQPEILLGVMAPLAAAYLPSQIGLRRTNDLLLTGRTITPEEAKGAGLINDVVDEEAFEKVVAGLLQKSRPALLATKRAIAKGRTLVFSAALRDAVAIYLEELMKAHDPVEGLTAFLEKRAPKFQDR